MGHGFPTGTSQYPQKNSAEQAIHTFKAHLIAVLSGVVPEFPQLLWDILIIKTETTLNFLRQ